MLAQSESRIIKPQGIHRNPTPRSSHCLCMYICAYVRVCPTAIYNIILYTRYIEFNSSKADSRYHHLQQQELLASHTHIPI